MPATRRARGLVENDTDSTRPTPQQTAGRLIRKARGRLDGEVAGHARLVADILARMSLGCYAVNDPVEFKLYARTYGAVPCRIRCEGTL